MIHIAYILIYPGAVVLHNQRLSSSVYNGLPLLRYVACEGTESRLPECDYDILQSGYCNSNFAGVYCQGNIAITQSSVLFAKT